MTKTSAIASHSSILDMAAALGLSEKACSRALQLAGLTPGRIDWLRYIDRFLTTIGVLLIVAGADPYGLFVAWAALILPLAIIGRQAANHWPDAYLFRLPAVVDSLYPA